MILNVKANDPHFQYQLKESQDAYLVPIWWFQLKSITSHRTDKLDFLEFWVKKAETVFKVNDPHFQYQLRVSQGACLLQIWWS